jgi:hypothetical protein
MGAQYTAELARLREQKRQHTATFIAGCRADIIKLWDTMYMSQEERDAFAAMHDGRPSIPARRCPSPSSHASLSWHACVCVWMSFLFARSLPLSLSV